MFADEQAARPILIGSFPAMPRVGEVLSIMNKDGYFDYFDVVEVWYRQSSAGEAFVACVHGKLDD